MVSETPTGFEPAKVIDDGWTQMDPVAYRTLRSYMQETGMKEEDMAALLHAFLRPCIEELEYVADALEGLDDRVGCLSRKRGSFKMVLKVREDDLLKLEKLMKRIKDAASSLRGDGKALVQAYLVLEGEKR